MLKGRVTDLKGVEKQLKTSNNQIAELEAKVAKLTQEVEVCFTRQKDFYMRISQLNKNLNHLLNDCKARHEREA